MRLNWFSISALGLSWKILLKFPLSLLAYNTNSIVIGSAVKVRFLCSALPSVLNCMATPGKKILPDYVNICNKLASLNNLVGLIC